MKNFVFTVVFILALSVCGNRNRQSDNPKEVMSSIQLTEEEFLTKVADYKTSPNTWKYLGDKPAIVDFYATWCGPCRMLAPLMENLAEQYKDQIYVYKVDVDKSEELARAYDIRSIPTLLFIPLNGKPTKVVGGMSKADLEKMVKETLLNQKKAQNEKVHL